MYKNLLLPALLVLSGCATFMDKATQEIEVRTPGAHDAVCDLYVGGLRYSVHTPDIVGVYKSEDDLKVHCKAPGNRERTVYIEPVLADHANWNLATAGAGYVYDYATKALFQYPSVIVVDFTGIPLSDAPLPAHNNPDIRQPEDYELEEFMPGNPRLNEDKYRVETPLLRRGETPGGYTPPERYNSTFSQEDAPDKGDLQPARSSAGGSTYIYSEDNAPYPLIPGE